MCRRDSTFGSVDKRQWTNAKTVEPRMSAYIIFQLTVIDQVGDNLVRDLPAFIEVTHARSFDRADMDEPAWRKRGQSQLNVRGR
jgi:hypothetical protein